MRRPTRRQITLTLGSVFAATTVAAGIAGLRGDHTDTAPSPARTAQPTASAGRTARDASEPVSAASPGPAPTGTETPSASAAATPSLPWTDDPVRYARAVAAALFDWDTTAGLMPSDYTAAVLADADPSGEETTGLIYDVATYLPTNDQWFDLASMHVRQTLTITTAAVPTSWPSILAQSNGALRPGTTAVTITATRHRTGEWNGTPTATEHPVAFSLFLACPPAFDRCHLLRLSQLDKPVE